VELFIDRLSKQLARTTSRRSMLSITSRTLFASFLTSTGIGRLWGSTGMTQTTSSSQTCPSCGVCQQCNTIAGKCGQECENPCTAAALCLTAQQYSPYKILQSFLVAQFTGASEPEALVLIEPSVRTTAVLSTNYVGTSPAQTARLVFTSSSFGLNAYAVEYVNGSPKFGYFVSSLGSIQQFLPPYSLITSGNGSTTSMVEANGRIATNTSTSAVSSSTCKAGCNLLCGILGPDCFEVADAVCIDSIVFGLEAPLLCVLLAYSLCFAGSGIACAVACENATCNNPSLEHCSSSVICGACQTCDKSRGICTAVTCPPGYSCDSTTGTCACSNLCGTACCIGQCVNNRCITKCPSGYTACGTTCCSSEQFCCGNTCCEIGDTCVNGSCATTQCPTGLKPCGGRCCAVCCPNGTSQPFCGTADETCCPAAGLAIGLCPPGDQCCSSGTNAGCFPSGGVCCTSREGSAFGCLPGEVCCGDKCAQICCATNVNGADYACPANSVCCFGAGTSFQCCPSTSPVCLFDGFGNAVGCGV